MESVKFFFRGFARPLPTPVDASAAQADLSEIGRQRPITIVTQNLWCHYAATPADELRCQLGSKRRYGACKDVMSGFSFARRLAAVADAVRAENADVVLVQELFLFRMTPLVTLSHNFITFQNLMRELGLVYHTTPTMSCGNVGQNSGLAIFSRFPIRLERSVVFANSSERLNNKGAVGAVLQLNATHRLAVVSTHLDSQSSNEVRFSQMKDVGALVKELQDANAGSGSNLAVAVTGDFNVCPQTVSEGGYDDGTLFQRLAWTMSQCGLQPVYAPTEAPHTIDQTALDHIFFSGMLPWDPAAVPPLGGAEREEARAPAAPAEWRSVLHAREASTGLAASDHLGLVARFRLPATDAA